jgi:hypothetical protein
VTQTFLNPEQARQFEQTGVLRLDGLLSLEGVRRAREALLRPLEAIGLWRDGRWRLDAAPRPVWPDNGVKVAREIGHKHPELLALIEEPQVQALVGQLLDGVGYDRSMANRPQVLFTLPNADAWTAPDGWHADSPRLASGRSPGVQLFAFLEEVSPGGGGTVVVAGSHRLLNEGRHLRSKEIRRRLSSEAFFRPAPGASAAELMARRGRVEGVELGLVELTGGPGDAWIVDLRTLHSMAPNAADRPRMMITQRFVRTDVAEELSQAYGWS